jgi:hypothetical protein
MRILRPDLLREYSKSPLDSLEIVDLRRYGIITLGETFKDCPNLHTIFLGENKLESLAGIENAAALWHLNASKNGITTVVGLGLIPAIGWLDLSHNNLTYSEVGNLVHIPMIDIVLENNPALTEGGIAHSQYRMNVVYLLPKVWMVDHAFVTAEERALAVAYFEEGGGVGSEIAVLASELRRGKEDCSKVGSGMFHLGGLGASSLLASQGGGASSGAEGDGETPSCVNRFLSLVAAEPHHPTICQSGRLSGLVQHHNEESARVSKHFSTALPRPGLQPITIGKIDWSPFRTLQRRQLLDLSVMLAVTVLYEVPDNVLLEALTMLLKVDVDMKHIESLAALPRYGRMVMAHHVKNILRQYVEDKNPAYVLNFIEKELYNALPEWTSRLNKERDTAIQPIDEDERIGQEHLSRHAVILFSRSPAFPSLVRGRDTSLSAHEKRVYERLVPLLTVAGMTNEDLHTEVDENLWKKRVENPSRHYSRPWELGDGAAVDVEGDQEANGASPPMSPPYGGFNSDEENDFAFLAQSGDEHETLVGTPGWTPRSARMNTAPLSVGANRIMTAGSEGMGEGMEAGSMFYKGIRIPKVNERVEMATQLLGRIYPQIVEVFDFGNVIKLESFPGATRTTQWLMHRDIFWNPKGYWRHGSGVSFSADLAAGARLSAATRLHRVNKGLTKSGLLASEGVANRALPEALAKLVLETPSAPGHEAKPLKIFANNKTWDPNFVVAPPKMVQAQNMYARAMGAPGDWDPIQTLPFIVKDSSESLQKGYVNRSADLRPVESSVYKVLENRLRQEDADEAEARSKMLDSRSNLLEGEKHQEESSSFFMTGVPGQTDGTETKAEPRPPIVEEEKKDDDSAPPPAEPPTPLQQPQTAPMPQAAAAPKRKQKGTGHSWYAVPNKASIMIAPRIAPSVVHGPFFVPTVASEKEKSARRLSRRLAQKKWARKEFADRSLSNRPKPHDQFHEPPKIKFNPVQGSMPSPLLPQPGLGVGLRARMDQTRKNFMRNMSEVDLRSHTQGSLSAVLSRSNMNSRYLPRTPKVLMADDDPRKLLESPLGSEQMLGLSRSVSAGSDYRALDSASSAYRKKKKRVVRKKRGGKRKKKVTRLAKRLEQMERQHQSMPAL